MQKKGQSIVSYGRVHHQSAETLDTGHLDGQECPWLKAG